jgi:apolipoprotein D and lipocalin family protein
MFYSSLAWLGQSHSKALPCTLQNMQILLALVLVFVTLQAIFANNSTARINTVTSLDIPKYLGLWYQISADQLVYSTIEQDNLCVTARYGDNGDGTISVHNYATLKTPNGATTVIDGYAYQPDASKPGQLKVQFDSVGPFPAPYWIVELGPVNAKGQYDWSIVSDSLSAYLFVLARDVATFNAKYRTYVYGKLATYGFTGLKKPIETYHGADCVYESTVRGEQMKKFESM